MAGIAQNGQKFLIYILVPLLRLENIKDCLDFWFLLAIYLFIYYYIQLTVKT